MRGAFGFGRSQGHQAYVPKGERKSESGYGAEGRSSATPVPTGRPRGPRQWVRPDRWRKDEEGGANPIGSYRRDTKTLRDTGTS